MEDKLISVIMSVYNEEPKWLKEAINSILEQSYGNIEFIIVIDNPLNKVLIEICKAYCVKDTRIILLINKENRGLVYSLNKAYKNSKGNYIARMDADDISHKERLQKQLLYLKEENLDLIGTNINLFKTNSSPFFTTNKLLTHKFIEKIFCKGTIGIVHPTFFGKREVFESLNGYSNAFHTEDKEFLARTFIKGFKVGNMKEVLLDCRYNDQSITKSNAIYVYMVGKYVTKSYKDYLRTGIYYFDEDYHNKLNLKAKDIKRFNKKQILLGELRAEFGNKRYAHFIAKLFIGLYYSTSIFYNIKLNFLLKIFKLQEDLILAKKRWKKMER